MDPKFRQSKVNPGWNDPPMLNYSSTNPPPKSRITNKRVAFPLSGNSQVSNSSPVAQALQCPNSTNPPPKSDITDKRVAFPFSGNAQVSNSSPVAQSLQYPSFPLTNESVPSDMKGILEKFSAADEDIQQFYKSWETCKIPEFQMNVHLLLKYIRDSDKNGVEKIKLKLLSEYKNVCESWLHYIKL